MKKILIGLLALTLSQFSLAGGYTGNEIQHTQVYDNNYTSGITVLRRYHKGIFIEGEIFNNKNEVFAGVGYQTGDMNTLLDMRLNKNNVKIFFMRRF